MSRALIRAVKTVVFAAVVVAAICGARQCFASQTFMKCEDRSNVTLSVAQGERGMMVNGIVFKPFENRAGAWIETRRGRFYVEQWVSKNGQLVAATGLNNGSGFFALRAVKDEDVSVNVKCVVVE